MGMVDASRYENKGKGPASRGGQDLVLVSHAMGGFRDRQNLFCFF